MGNCVASPERDHSKNASDFQQDSRDFSQTSQRGIRTLRSNAISSSSSAHQVVFENSEARNPLQVPSTTTASGSRVTPALPTFASLGAAEHDEDGPVVRTDSAAPSRQNSGSELRHNCEQNVAKVGTTYCAKVPATLAADQRVEVDIGLLVDSHNLENHNDAVGNDSCRNNNDGHTVANLFRLSMSTSDNREDADHVNRANHPDRRSSKILSSTTTIASDDATMPPFQDPSLPGLVIQDATTATAFEGVRPALSSSHPSGAPRGDTTRRLRATFVAESAADIAANNVSPLRTETGSQRVLPPRAPQRPSRSISYGKRAAAAPVVTAAAAAVPVATPFEAATEYLLFADNHDLHIRELQWEQRIHEQIAGKMWSIAQAGW